MICLSGVCDKWEDNPNDSRDCAKCEGVSHHICSKNVADFYLQRDIHPSIFYCSQACMMSMDKAMSVDGN